MSTLDHPRTALVIGVNGSFGGHAAAALLQRGWRVRALARDLAAARDRCGARMPIAWIAGDALDPAAVVAAADGCQVIVHAANPPRYRNWKGLVLPMIRATLAAAKANGARVALPGTVYNYAPDAGLAIAEGAPQAPVTRKGAIRVEMERLVREAAAQGVKSLILRAGDFFGPAAPNSALQWLTLRRGGALRGVYDPGEAAHAFAYLPDLANTLGQLLDREGELEDAAVYHFGGHVLTFRELGQAIAAATGQPDLPIRAFPRWLLTVAAPFDETLRELREMTYLWDRPIGLDNRKLIAFLGEEPRTELAVALRATVADLLEPPPAPPAARPAARICWTRSAAAA